jgi:hypothetical protein
MGSCEGEYPKTLSIVVEDLLQLHDSVRVKRSPTNRGFLWDWLKRSSPRKIGHV